MDASRCASRHAICTSLSCSIWSALSVYALAPHLGIGSTDWNRSTWNNQARNDGAHAGVRVGVAAAHGTHVSE
jgi:hypothetical protein